MATGHLACLEFRVSGLVFRVRRPYTLNCKPYTLLRIICGLSEGLMQVWNAFSLTLAAPPCLWAYEPGLP